MTTSYRVNSTEDVWGLALNLYGDAAGVLWLLQDNSELVDGDGLVEVASTTVQVRKLESWKVERSTQLRIQAAIQTVRQHECMATSQQTVWDIALQQYGDADAIAWLFAENSDLVNTNGLLEDGRRRYLLRNDFFDFRMRERMLEVIPSTGSKSQNEAWVTDDGQPWVTDDGQIWVTG